MEAIKGAFGKKPTVLVAGASGRVGTATTRFLFENFGSEVKIVAGTRDPDGSKAMGLKEIDDKLNVVPFDSRDVKSLKDSMKKCDRLIIITPSSENRARLVSNMCAEAKDCGVKFIALISATMVKVPGSIFGDQFREIESIVEGCGVPYCIVRAPWFMDNLCHHRGEIKSSGEMTSCLPPNTPFSAISVQDLALALATIGRYGAERFRNAIYTLTAPPFSYGEVAAILSRLLKIPVTYRQVEPRELQAAYEARGTPSWSAHALREYFEAISTSTPVDLLITKEDDFETVTGTFPSRIDTWLSCNITKFGGEEREEEEEKKEDEEEVDLAGINKQGGEAEGVISPEGGEAINAP